MIKSTFPVLKVITLKTNRVGNDPKRMCIAREKQRLREKWLMCVLRDCL